MTFATRPSSNVLSMRSTASSHPLEAVATTRSTPSSGQPTDLIVAFFLFVTEIFLSPEILF
jgi:hypothetical protein